MPNAASLDADFRPRAPGRRKSAQPAARKKGRKPSLARSVAMLDSVPRYGAIAISALIGVGIIVNALMMQHGNHPAPLFGGGPIRPAAAKPAAPQPAASAAAKPDIPATPVAAPAAASAADAPARASSPARTGHGDDAIARLIGAGTAGTTAHRARSASDRPAAGKPAKSTSDKHRKADD